MLREPWIGGYSLIVKWGVSEDDIEALKDSAPGMRRDGPAVAFAPPQGERTTRLSAAKVKGASA